MLATKNRVAGGFIFIIAVGLLFTGCGQPGPRALLQGKNLLERGKYNEAAVKLKTAATLLSTNAQAWNYLGLAYHRARQPTNAVTAYQKALMLDRNLLEARFNLGCLWLEQDNPEAARAEFTAYTLHRPNAVEAWVKLGFAQLGSRDTAAAEKSFSEAVRLDSQNADAFNGIGLAQLQRNRPKEAAQYFASALKQKPGHRPALLNLAKVLQVNLNDRPGALRRYREYLALKPKPADWDAVNEVANALEQQLAAQQRPPQTNVAAQVVSSTPVIKTQATATRPIAPPKPETAKPTPAPTPTQYTPVPVEVVNLAPEPAIKTAPDVSTAPVSSPQTETSAAPETASNSTAVVTEPEKRGFFQKLNIFRREPKVTSRPTPLPSATSQTQQPATSNVPPPAATASAILAKQPPSPSAKSPAVARYKYVAPRFPAPGNRADADRAFAQGVKSREADHLSDAAQSFRQAVKSDPAYFEAQFNLALTEFELRQHKKSLATWETTLAIRPDSADARYNFALALKAANYPLDAANELEKILVASPNEARTHLALGNLYAEPLRDTARARAHYLIVLELSPGHPQGSAIRYWLVSNPQ